MVIEPELPAGLLLESGEREREIARVESTQPGESIEDRIGTGCEELLVLGSL